MLFGLICVLLEKSGKSWGQWTIVKVYFIIYSEISVVDYRFTDFRVKENKIRTMFTVASTVFLLACYVYGYWFLSSGLKGGLIPADWLTATVHRKVIFRVSI